MAEAHQHAEDRSAYYLDQLFSIGVCGAFAAVTIMLWRTGILIRMIAERFHIWVILGGCSLLAIVVLRAIAVWRSVDEQQPQHEHGPECDHSHGHGHDGDHSHGHGHDHEHHHEARPTAPIQPTANPGGVLSLSLAGAPAVAVPHSHGHSHSHGDGHDHGWAPWRYVMLLLPVVLYFLVLSNPSLDTAPVDSPSTAGEHIQNFILVFRSILWEAMPFIVLGALIAGLLEELLPQRVLASLLPRNRFLAIVIGGLLGLIFPMCECGIIPIMRRLLRKGLPLSCCVSYVLAGPIINFVVILSTVAAFSGMENVYEGNKPSYQMGSWWMAGFRVGLGYLIAVVTSLCVEWQHRKHGDSLLTPLARPSKLPIVEEENVEPRTLWQRVSNITETSLHDFVDISVFLIIGALLAAGSRLFLTPDRIAYLSSKYAVLSIALMMGLAVILTLCSEADAFVAASFATLRPSAKLAFLVLGPMLDCKLYFMYTRVFRPRLMLTIYVAIISQTFVYSVAVHYFWERYAPSLITPQRPAAPTISEAERRQIEIKASRTFGLVIMPAPGTSKHLDAITAMSMLLIDPNEETHEISFLELERASQTPEQRGFYNGRRVILRGRYQETPDGFTLTRFKINCCAADATPLKAMFVVQTDKTLPKTQWKDKWLKVTGRVQFIQPRADASWYTIVIVAPNERESLENLVEVIPPDPNPFIY